MGVHSVRRVLITGSRDWVDRLAVWSILNQELEAAHGELIVVHGAARGADDIADRWAWGAIQAGASVEVESHPALWEIQGKAAGIIRNKQMANLGADVCYAFPLKDSRGTQHMIACCEEAGIPVINLGYLGG